MSAGVRVIDALPGDELSLDVLARVAERHAEREITVTCNPPPIPVRDFDWTAIEPSGYEPGAPMGCGATAEAALVDLLDQIEDADPDPWTAADSAAASEWWHAEQERRREVEDDVFGERATRFGTGRS